MGANGAVGQPLNMTFSKFLHVLVPFHHIGRKNTSKGCANFVNILKAPVEKMTAGECYAESYDPTAGYQDPAHQYA
jgi:hypothetical protein